MKLINIAERGATVYISDLGIKVDTKSGIDVSLFKANSTDLLYAIENGLITVTFTEIELLDPQSAVLRERIVRASAQREGEVLYQQLQADIAAKSRNRLIKASNPYIQPAALVLVE